MDLNKIDDIEVQIALEEEAVCTAKEKNHSNDVAYHEAIIKSLKLLKSMKESKTENKFEQILKETYLEISNDKNIFNEFNSKSDVQALTASKFKNTVLRKMEQYLDKNPIEILDKEKFQELAELWYKYLGTVDAEYMFGYIEGESSDSILDKFNSKFEEYIGRPITLAERFEYFPSNDD